MSHARRTNISNLLMPDQHVDTGDVSFTRGNGCIQGTYPIEPCRHAGVDVEDPGTRDWYYLRSEQLLVVDLGDNLSNQER